MTAAASDLQAESTGLYIVDVQEKIAGAMPEKVLKGTLKNWLNWVEIARVLNLPVAISEQYPNGLGATLPVIAEALLRLPKVQVMRFEKLCFSAWNAELFRHWVLETKRNQWIIVGLETHVCVLQTAKSLVGAGMSVHVPRDAVISRTSANWEIGLELMRHERICVSSTETALFELLKVAGTDEFRSLSKLIK